MYDLIVRDARLYPMAGTAEAAPVTSFAVSDGRVAAFDIPEGADSRETITAQDSVVLPGFVECHTHLVWAGNRMDDHRQKLAGKSYEEISRAGGGIASTVKAVRGASQADIVTESRRRLDALIDEGVTTCEIKSGYGLDAESELKLLAAIREMGEAAPIHLSPTFLGAHATPPDGDRARWLDEIIEELLPRIAEDSLADTVDIYVESIAFDIDDLDRLAAATRDHDLALRAHTEQLSAMGGTRRAAELGALSCDHLEYATEDDVRAMAAHGTIAVLLPSAFYFLREEQRPPVQMFRDLGVPIAVSTDLNPGTSPVASLLTAMHMGGILFGLTVEEILLGATLHAARAMGRAHEVGSLEVGKRADFTFWDIPSPDHLAYQLGGVRPRTIFVEGQKL